MPITAEDAAHLLRRSGFVASASRMAQLGALERAAAVETVLDTSANPSDAPPASVTFDGDGYAQLVTTTQWWIDRMVSTPTPVVEKLALFWHGHFTSEWWKVNHTPSMVNQNRLVRSHALGDFPSLCQQIAVDPAMLVYLDNESNRTGSPNQNFARELMELFMLGVGNYSEDDVIAAAEAWTGHGLNGARQYTFTAAQHQYGNKTFFGTTRDWDGPEIITEILANPAKRMVIARFIAKKLWEFLAYQNPSSAIVDAVAQAFVDSAFNVRNAVRAVFLRDEFWSATAKQGAVRSPIEYVVAVLSATGLTAAEVNVQWFLENMGQHPFLPPNVSGWRLNNYWLNASAFGGRASFARHVAWMLRDRGWWSDSASLSVDAAIDRAAATFGLAPLSTTTRSAMAGYLSSRRSVSGESWAEPVNLLTMAMLAPELQMA